MNCYAPYVEHHKFWENISLTSLLNYPNLIIGKDLTLYLDGREIWGIHALSDPLVEFISDFFSLNGPLDIWEGALVPTWKNGRKNQDYNGKMIDFFLMSEDLPKLLRVTTPGWMIFLFLTTSPCFWS